MPETEDVLREIADSLKKIANLLALGQVSSQVQQVDKVMILNAVGYSHADAAELLGTTADTVRVTVNQEKRRASKKTVKKSTKRKKSSD